MPVIDHLRARWPWLVAGAVLFLSIVLVGYGLSRRQATPVEEKPILSVVAGRAGKAGEVLVTQQALKLAEIEVAPATVRSVADKLTLTGIVRSGGNQKAKITPQVAGEVVEIRSLIGDQVKKGQVLACLASPELARAQADFHEAAARLEVFEADLARKEQLASLGEYGSDALEDSHSRAVEAERNLLSARRSVAEKEAELTEARSQVEVLANRLAQAEAELAVKKAHYERARAVPEVVSLQNLERLRADFEKAKADVAVARASKLQGEAHLQVAGRNLETAIAEQPLVQKEYEVRRRALSREEKIFSGGFSRNQELVDAQARRNLARVELSSAAERVKLLGGSPGGGSRVLLRSPIAGKVEEASLTLGESLDSDQVAFIVVNLDRVWATLAVAPKDLPKLAVGDQVELRADAAPDRTFQARLTSVGTTTDETTRTVPVTVAIDHPEAILAAGSYVQATVLTEVHHDRLTVPTSALQEHTGRATIYVASPEQVGRFEVRHVVLGIQEGDWQEIADGLAPNESLAIGGTFYLKSEALKSSLSDGCCAVGK